MSEANRIATQMKQAFEGPCWAGPSFMDILEGVDAKAAAAKPIAGAHSIWEVVMHVVSGQQIMLRFVRGESNTAASTEDWWQPVPDAKDTVAWTKTLDLLKKQEAELSAAVAQMTDAQLEKPFVTDGSSAYNNLHGHVQHNLYHAGQILMLKRAQGMG